jgi:hypothetical protein
MCDRGTGEPNPANDLQTGEDECHDEANLCSSDDTARRIPVTDRYEENHGGCHDRWPNKQHGHNGQEQRNAVVQGPMVLQVFELMLSLAPFEARRA